MKHCICVAAKGVILREGKALLLRRSPDDDFGPGQWEFPGGTLEFGEGLEDCLRREVREETGLTIRVQRLLYANTFLTQPWRQVVVVSYLCQPSEEEVRLSAEHTAFLWAGKEELGQLLPLPVLEELEAHHILPQIFPQ